MSALLTGSAIGIAVIQIAARFVRIRAFVLLLDRFESSLFSYSEASDDIGKERAITTAALYLFSVIFFLVLVLCVIVLMFIGPPTILGFGDQALLLYSLGTLVSLPYLRIRSKVSINFEPEPVKKNSKLAQSSHSRYSFLSRVFHWIVLEPEPVRRISFWLETKIFARSDNSKGLQTRFRAPVFVCGLARSGTTIIMDILHKTGNFASLTYADMPFVMAPNLWHRIRGNAANRISQVERAHADGILINSDSPESFEEVFWRTYCDPKLGPGLGYQNPSLGALDRFKTYQRLVILSKHNQRGGVDRLRYLSKNNNNILRLGPLLQDTEASVVLIIRNPLATAWSLFEQHKRFSSAFGDDRFDRAYLRWLGHYEFGVGHLPFEFAVDDLNGFTPIEPNYWLQYWNNVYNHLIAITGNPQVCIVSHDQLCMDGARQIDRLLCFLDIPIRTDNLALMIKSLQPLKDDVEQYFDPALVKVSMELYSRFISVITK